MSHNTGTASLCVRTALGVIKNAKLLCLRCLNREFWMIHKKVSSSLHSECLQSLLNRQCHKLAFAHFYVRHRLVKMDDGHVERAKMNGPQPPIAFLCFSILQLCSCSMPPPVMWQEYHSGDREEPNSM